MSSNGKDNLIYTKFETLTSNEVDNSRTLIFVATRAERSWLDLAVLASLPPLYNLTNGTPLVLICNDITTSLDSNSKKFLLQYKPQKVITIGDEFFSPDISSIIPNVIVHRIMGKSLDELTVKISKEFFLNSPSAILIEITDYASALTISPYASYTNTPIFYYNKKVSEIVLNELYRLGIQKIVLLNPSMEIINFLQSSFKLDIINSTNEIINRTIQYLKTIDYVTVANPLDRENGNKVSLVAPLFTLYHKGILIPTNYSMNIISVPPKSYSLVYDRPIGAPDTPLRYCDFDPYKDEIPRSDSSTWKIYPVNGSFFKRQLPDLNPLDSAGIYFTECYLGASIFNSTKIDIIAIDLDRDAKISDNEVFKIVNETLEVPYQGSMVIGNYKFTHVKFKNFVEKGVSLFCKSSTWIKGQILFGDNPVTYVLSLSLTKLRSLDFYDGAYGYFPVNYILINFDWNNDGDFSGKLEGPYTVGNSFIYGNKTYLINFNFFLYEKIGEIWLIYPSPITFKQLIYSQVRNHQVKYICLVGDETFVPMQYSLEPFISRNLLPEDYDYSGPSSNNLYPAVGRINTYNVTDASIIYLRTVTYKKISSEHLSRKALILCDHDPPYSISELRYLGYDVSLMGNMNYSKEKIWRDMHDSDIVLLNVGHATWPFEYAELDFNKPSLVIHWMCKSAYQLIGYKRFFHAGAILFIGTTEDVPSPEGGNIELIHALLNQLLVQNCTIGEAFNIAKLFVTLRMRERGSPYNVHDDLRLLTIMASSLYGDPAFRLYVSHKINNTLSYSYLKGFYTWNSTHILAYVDVNSSIEAESYWETFEGAWCSYRGPPILISHYRVEGLIVSEFEEATPLDINLVGAANVLPPTQLFMYPIPENAEVVNITLTSPLPHLIINEKVPWTIYENPFSSKYLIFKKENIQYLMWTVVLANYCKENKSLHWFADKISFRVYLIMKATRCQLIISTNGGLTDPPPGNYSYFIGTKINVTAVRYGDYSLYYWLLDDKIKTENPITIIIDSNHTLYAHFIDTIAPITIDDYDGLWHNSDFIISLKSLDRGSGVLETYYRINNGPVKQVSVDGQPLITSEGANNTLEYWSVDNAGNEEYHKFLTRICLDKTAPVAHAGQDVQIKVGDTCNFDASKSTDNIGIGCYVWDFGDGKTAEGKTVNHKYSNPGTYKVTLTVKDFAGNTNTYIITVTVQTTPSFETTISTSISTITTSMPSELPKERNIVFITTIIFAITSIGYLTFKTLRKTKS
ncbi:MAG: PKD domain-containing protein [Nitrososphaeria archaeon]